MADSKRLFIGVKVYFEEKAEAFYLSLPQTLDGAEVKWVDLKNLHITIKFLGEVKQENISSIIPKLKYVSRKYNGFEVLLKGVGIFKDFYHPKVLWFGLRNCGELEKIKNEIENSLGDLGFEVDYRKFTPHLTVGRFKQAGSVKELQKLVNSNQDQYFQLIPVNEIILFESLLKNEGTEYKIIESFPLGKEEEFKEFRF
jgi:RNA 2',3'-cyclic 3'-phosphodiesterase